MPTSNRILCPHPFGGLLSAKVAETFVTKRDLKKKEKPLATQTNHVTAFTFTFPSL